MRIGPCVLIVAAVALVCMGQQAADDAVVSQPTPPKVDNAPPRTPGVISLPHMTIDTSKRQIVLQSNVCLRQGMLELLVCSFGSKEHESILNTQVRPSDLHAALLLLGLRPGMPAQWFQMGDQPPRAIPPRGAALDIRLRWRDADTDGEVHDVSAGQWLRQVGPTEAVSPDTWIFVGSDLMADDGYRADSSGEIISVSNFAASVIDVPFASSSANADLLFITETDAIPPLGTPVEVVITLSDEPAIHARAWVRVDRMGQFLVDHRLVTPEELEKWTLAYIQEYPKGQIIVRSDPRAMGADVQTAVYAVRMGGAWDIVETRYDLAEPVLPRTPTQAKAALAQLQAELADEGIYGDPHADAAATLARIERETAELERLKALWSEYAAHITQMLDEHPKPEPENSETP